MKQPQKMTFAMIRDAVENNEAGDDLKYYMAEDIGMVNGFGGKLFNAVIEPGVPYRIDDYRCGMLLKGSIHSNVNLIDRHITPGHIVLLTPGTIVQSKEITPDFCLQGVIVKPDTLHIAMGGRLPSPIATARMQAFILQPDLRHAALVGKTFALLWDLVHTPDFSTDALHALIATQIHQLCHLISTTTQASDDARHHQRQVFERFIYLVNKNCRQEHQIAFYASRMCLSERYLGTVVRQVSGVTAKEWIDRALVTEAKVMLRHGNRQTTEIAEELGFSNASFFCKYFRRLTGLSPSEYRQSGAARG